MMAIAAGCQSDDLLELPGKIIHVIVAQRGGHLFDRHGGAVQQIAGALHLHMDKVLDGRLSAPGFKLLDEVIFRHIHTGRQCVQAELSVNMFLHGGADPRPVKIAVITLPLSCEQCDVAQ